MNITSLGPLGTTYIKGFSYLAKAFFIVKIKQRTASLMAQF